MEADQLNRLMFGIDNMTGYSNNPIESNQKMFDKEKFESRIKLYEKITRDNKLTIFEASKKVGIEYDDFLNEIHVFAAINPGKVSIRYLSGYFRSGLSKQKEISAICWIKEHVPKITIDYLCERLNISEQHAMSIIKQHDMDMQLTDALKRKMRLTYVDIVSNERIQKPVIKFFNENPNASISKCIRVVDLNVTESTMRNALEKLVEKGYKIPCMLFIDPMLEEKSMLEIVAYKEKNPYSTPKMLAVKFNTTQDKIFAILDVAAEQYRVEKIRSYEFYFKGVLDEIDNVGELCMERFAASPASSSRWLEIKQMGIEKKIKMLGLNAPSEVRIHQSIQIESKEDKDAIIEAYMATDLLNITPQGILHD